MLINKEDNEDKEDKENKGDKKHLSLPDLLNNV